MWRKSYLIRSSLEDLPVLTPVYESQEPTQLSSDSDRDRPESPLPNLIIEKELTRDEKYHQDEEEPKDFYDNLAKVMRKLYKRDFHHVEKDSTTSSDTIYEIRNENYTQIDKCSDEERSLEAERLDKIDVLEEDDYYSKTRKEEETQKTMSTSSDNDNTESEVICSNQITFEGQVHTNYEEITDQPLPETIHASEDSVDPCDMRKIIEVSFASEENEQDKQEEGIELTKP